MPLDDYDIPTEAPAETPAAFDPHPWWPSLSADDPAGIEIIRDRETLLRGAIQGFRTFQDIEKLCKSFGPGVYNVFAIGQNEKRRKTPRIVTIEDQPRTGGPASTGLGGESSAVTALLAETARMARERDEHARRQLQFAEERASAELERRRKELEISEAERKSIHRRHTEELEDMVKRHATAMETAQRKLAEVHEQLTNERKLRMEEVATLRAQLQQTMLDARIAELRSEQQAALAKIERKGDGLSQRVQDQIALLRAQKELETDEKPSTTARLAETLLNGIAGGVGSSGSPPPNRDQRWVDPMTEGD